MDQTKLRIGSQVVAGHAAGPSQACGLGMYLGAGADLRYVVDVAGCGSGVGVSAGPPVLGVWTHLAGSYDGDSDTMRIYKNGVMVAEMSGVPFNPSNWMTAGAVTFFNGQQAFYSGELDELRIWSTVRTQAQILENMTWTLTGLESGLVGYWKMDDATGQDVSDSSPTGKTGTLGTTSAVQGSDPTWVVSDAPVSDRPCVVNTIAALSEPQEEVTVAAAKSGAISSTAASESKGAGRGTRLNPAAFRRLRDEVLVRSPAGRRYAALYAAHSAEVVRLLLMDSTLRAAILDGLLLWQTNVAALVDGRAAAVTVTADQARAVDVVVDRLAKAGSPALRRAIEEERRTHPPGFNLAQAVLREIGREDNRR